MKKDGWGDGEDVVREQVKKNRRTKCREGVGRQGENVPHWGNLEG